MNEQYISDRISVLRTKKNVSEYKMSLDLGHSKSYIQSISSGRSLPSMSEFLSICEFLGITPKDFFDDNIEEPSLIHELTNEAKTLQKDDLELLVSIARRLNGRSK
ncbi:MAG: helix-turn-helix domain-containing protein [Clostridiales bacterium]|nr:helix-turn-helix domain-containing protein [Clostridiales bacterium]